MKILAIAIIMQLVQLPTAEGWREEIPPSNTSVISTWCEDYIAEYSKNGNIWIYDSTGNIAAYAFQKKKILFTEYSHKDCIKAVKALLQYQLKKQNVWDVKTKKENEKQKK